MKRPPKKKLADLLVEREFVESRDKAAALIMAGKVLVGGERVDKPGHEVASDAEIRLKESSNFVGRGALKLEGAFKRFELDVAGRVCADVGSSTGGFTEVLLKAGAARVYAIDVGYNELAWKLRNDPRVVVMERTNARHLKSLPEQISFASIDVSFISLKLILPNVKNWLEGGGSSIVALIKPQFEAPREKVEQGGIVRSPEVHECVLKDILGFAASLGLYVHGLCVSPITGAQGNKEFLAWLNMQPQGAQEVDVAIEKVLQKSP